MERGNNEFGIGTVLLIGHCTGGHLYDDDLSYPTSYREYERCRDLCDLWRIHRHMAYDGAES